MAEQRFGHAGERAEGKHQLDRHAEHRGNLQRQLEARVVVAAFEEPDRLRVDPDLLGQRLAAHPRFGAEHRESVVYFPSHACELA